VPRTFVIRPFGIKKDTSGKSIDFERVHAELIKPALVANQLDGDTTGEIVDAGNIRDDMFRLILEADVVVADITVHNANAFYELGIRHALRKKTTVLIKGDPTEDKTPFDLLTDRYLSYDVAEPAKRVADLTRAIGNSMVSNRVTDSPIFQMIPNLPEADPENVQVVPPDFQEEVGRAATAKGWLRLLSDEVRGQRFERSGLKLVGYAQWKAKDYDGASETWEKVRETNPDDVAANLALANIYERQSRDSWRSPDDRADLLKRSDQAIERALRNASASRKDRAEALTLRGRNQKTHWRMGLEKASSVPERRQAALNRSLVESYESYLGAFRADLNHFYPGLGALQMGSILLDLSGESGWKDVFDDDRTAENYRIDLEDTVRCLRSAVSLSVDAALEKTEGAGSEDKWARISEADVLFLTSDNDRRVEKAYQAVFAKSSPFDWDASRGQLELFADLGVKTDRARAVIAAVEKVLGKEVDVKTRPTHLVVFAGHQVDEPGRAEPRFPADREPRARMLIKAAIERLLDQAHDFVGLGSASPGADIVWHEVCAELGLKTALCLPMPVADHAARVFGSRDDWRARFLDLVQVKKRQVLTLSDRYGLPRWLEPTGMDPWVRGNEWVMKMALAWGADKVSLVAFWDGREQGAGSSGTAQVVQLARDAGTVRVERIDSTQLLA
jgi:tetratricopeptide (TPR) repeat protein